MPNTARLTNLTGTVALAITTDMLTAVEAATGLAPQEAAALNSLANWADGKSIERLRQLLDMSQPGCARLVDRLVDRRLARRQRDTTDRRVTVVRITPAGRRLAAHAADTRTRTLERWTSQLDAAQRVTLQSLFEQLVGTGVVDGPSANRRCRLCDPAGCTGSSGCPVTAAAVQEMGQSTPPGPHP